MAKNDFIDIENIGIDNQLIILLEYISQTRDIDMNELGDIFKQIGIIQ